MLRDVRKRLGYFLRSDLDVSFRSDLLPHTPLPTVGISCIGAAPVILNLNIKMAPHSPRNEVTKVTKFVRIPNLVESLTLSHENGVLEIACNLKDTNKCSVAHIVEVETKKANELGLRYLCFLCFFIINLQLILFLSFYLNLLHCTSSLLISKVSKLNHTTRRDQLKKNS